ncbi:MAG: universal stress protein [Candidatus Thorarchaeota archaeon]|nr:MAG: universal stress protein [Candidatus Thorarchaeota archaeon]
MGSQKTMEDSKTIDEILYCDPGRVFCRTREVLLGVDGSEAAARAATVAFELAEMTESKLFILHVLSTPTITQYSMMSDANLDEVMAKYRENGKKLLKGYGAAAEDFGVKCELVLEEGLPADRIISVAKEKDVDIIVMGSQGLETGKRPGMGGSTERVILGTDCPVLVVK